jgi:hypothetical protein
MKITRILTLSALAAAAAFAQTSGTITINGSIPDSISITDNTASNAALTATTTLGTLVAANNSTLATLAVPVGVRIRSNKQFKLNAVAVFTNAGFGSDDGGQAITASDIGFGITAKNVAGANVVTARGLDSIDTRFDYITTTFGSLTVTNGRTPFNGTTHGTLNEIGTSTQLMQGNRISKLGNIQSDDNFMLLSFNVATLPQYFSPTTGFSAVITLTPVTF